MHSFFTSSRRLATRTGIGALLLLAMAASNAATSWTVRSSASSLTFNTTKNGKAGVGGVTETMRFTRYGGGVNAQGKVELNIDLSSIDSGIGIRDERMQTMLWNVAQFPAVTFTAQISPESIPAVGQGPVILDVQGQLTMAGQTKPVTAQLMLSAFKDSLQVSTRKAILINAEDFGLTPGVEALRAVMGLSHLSGTVPVSFQLELVPEGAKSAQKP